MFVTFTLDVTVRSNIRTSFLNALFSRLCHKLFTCTVYIIFFLNPPLIYPHTHTYTTFFMFHLEYLKL